MSLARWPRMANPATKLDPYTRDPEGAFTDESRQDRVAHRTGQPDPRLLDPFGLEERRPGSVPPGNVPNDAGSAAGGGATLHSISSRARQQRDPERERQRERESADPQG